MKSDKPVDWSVIYAKYLSMFAIKYHKTNIVIETWYIKHRLYHDNKHSFNDAPVEWEIK